MHIAWSFLNFIRLVGWLVVLYYDAANFGNYESKHEGKPTCSDQRWSQELVSIMRGSVQAGGVRSNSILHQKLQAAFFGETLKG